jgi:insulysin
LKQSPNDSKQYQAITLENGLRVLLIHNEETEKSAAALAVNVGHFNDPDHREGMAHFLEHMLFLGTEKYPEGSEYHQFISQYGGAHNAWTATEHTCFFFDIHFSHFNDALDRFSQFFIAPLLSESFINKERQNIDAEFQLKFKDDIRRLYDAHKETVNQEHPFSKFSVGSLDTLADRGGISIREEIVNFYQEFYRAQYMTLAIEGPQSLVELSALAKQYFSAIKSTSRVLAPVSAPLYLAEHQQILINVDPLKNDRQLIISFAMPCIDQYYRHKPESVLSYLLGHEGPGSILSRLKRKQWALGLTAGSGINGSNFKDFNISIPLTELGEKHIDEIITTVFNYINLLQDNDIPEHYYQEKRANAELSFHYHEQMHPLDSVSQLVLNMQHYDSENYIFGDYMMEGMCQKTIKKLLNYLRADNIRLTHISQKNDFDQCSFWYRTPYSISKISANNIKKWQSTTSINDLFLPPKNLYIVKDPKLMANHDTSTEKNKKQLPLCLESENGLAIWFKQDTTFNVPKGYIYINIESKFTIESIENIAMTRLFVDLYSDAIIEEHYDAELAGIHYHLYAHQGGVTLQVSGLSEKQGHLLTLLLNNLQHRDFAESHFNLLKKQLLNHLSQADKSKSISQLFSKLSSIMQPKSPSSESLHHALSPITFEFFLKFSQQIFNEITLEVLIHGNWNRKQALALSQTIKDAFKPHYDAKYSFQIPVLDLTKQAEIILPLVLPKHDHATVFYYPFKDKTVPLIAKSMIVSHLLSPFFFQEMRTEKQLGYLVGVGYVPIHRFPGIAFYIQSPHTDSSTLRSCIDEFIEHCSDYLEDMPEDNWHHLQHGLAGQLKEKDATLRVTSQRFWAAICNEDKLFNHRNDLIDAILSLTLDDIRDFIQENLLKSNNPDRITLMSIQNKEELASLENSGKILMNIKELTNICQSKF